MRSKLLLLLFVLASACVLHVTHAQETEPVKPPTALDVPQDPAQDEEEGVRGVFLKSRETKSGGTSSFGSSGGGTSSFGTPIGKSTPKPTPRPTPKPTPRPTPRSTPRPTPIAKTTPKPPKSPVKTTPTPETAGTKPTKTNNTVKTAAGTQILAASLTPSNIGLGYSLFQRGANDQAFRTDTSNEFRTGDQVRIWLEPNVDGYLYIFNTTNNGKATIIYPDIRLNGGENKVKAHFPFELPGANTPAPNNWFSFYGSAGTESLYIVLTREPIKGVPSGPAALKAYCAENKDSDGQCLVQDNVWAGIRAFDQKEQVVIAKNTREVGQKQTLAEDPDATGKRGFGLAPTEAAPTVVFMNASADRSVLFAKLDLIHK